MALDEAGRVRSSDELHVDGTGPAEHHDEGPDPSLSALIVSVGEAPPVHLRLFTRLRLEAYSRLNPAPPATRGYAGLHQGVASLIAQTLQLPPQHHTVLQPFGKPPIHVLPVRIQLGPP